MKRVIKFLPLLVFAFFVSLETQAQAPGMFNFQAVARTATGYMTGPISVRITVSDGVNTYLETHSTGITANQYGLFTVNIGNGTSTSPKKLAELNWSTSPVNVTVEVNPGTGFVTIGSQRLLSVPYALYANSAGNSTGGPSNTIRSGTGIPQDNLGADGDFYIDNTNKIIYGPKVAGAWPANGTSMTGTGSGSNKIFKGVNGVKIDSLTTPGTFTFSANFDSTKYVKAGNVPTQTNKNQILMWDGTQWIFTNLPQGLGPNTDTDSTDNVTITSDFGGDVKGKFNNLKIVKDAVKDSSIQSVNYSKILPGSAQEGQVLKLVQGAWVPMDDAGASTANGIKKLNGAILETQNFQVDTTNAKDFDIKTDSANGIHTFSVPVLGKNGVVKGLLSNEDYKLFKTSIGNATPVTVGPGLLIDPNNNITLDIGPSLNLLGGKLRVSRFGIDSINVPTSNESKILKVVNGKLMFVSDSAMRFPGSSTGFWKEVSGGIEYTPGVVFSDSINLIDGIYSPIVNTTRVLTTSVNASEDINAKKISVSENLVSLDSIVTDKFRVKGGSIGVGKVLTSDSRGIATWQDLPGGSGGSYLPIGGIGVTPVTNKIKVNVDTVTLDTIPVGSSYVIGVKKAGIDTAYIKPGKSRTVLSVDKNGDITWLSRDSLASGASSNQWTTTANGINNTIGNVGIGGPATKNKISVYGGLNIDNGNTVDKAYSHVKRGPYLVFGHDSSGEGISSLRNDDIQGLGSKLGLDFFTNYSTRMTISHQGLVGIGTTMPKSMLHVGAGGEIRFDTLASKTPNNLADSSIVGVRSNGVLFRMKTPAGSGTALQKGDGIKDLSFNKINVDTGRAIWNANKILGKTIDLKDSTKAANTFLKYDKTAKKFVLDTVLIGNGKLHAFSAYGTTNQVTTSGGSGATTKITFEATNFNTDNDYNTSSSKFLPTEPGIYFLSAAVANSIPNNVYVDVEIWKNGVSYLNGVQLNNGGTCTVEGLVEANGTTDYFEIHIGHGSGSYNTVSGRNSTYFHGFKVGRGSGSSGSTTSDSQQLSLTGNTLSLTNSPSVTLPISTQYTKGKGIDLTGNKITALNDSAGWNANRILGFGISGTPGNGKVLRMQGGVLTFLTDSTGTGSGKIYTSNSITVDNTVDTLGLKDGSVKNAKLATGIGVAKLATAGGTDAGKVLTVNASGVPIWATSTGGIPYTKGKGIDLTGNKITALNDSAGWNANRILGFGISGTPGNGKVLRMQGGVLTFLTDSTGTGSGKIYTSNSITVDNTADTLGLKDGSVKNAKLATGIGVAKLATAGGTDAGKVLTVNASGVPIWATSTGGIPYTKGKGIDLTGNKITALNDSAGWNANRILGFGISGTPGNGKVLRMQGGVLTFLTDSTGTGSGKIYTSNSITVDNTADTLGLKDGSVKNAKLATGIGVAKLATAGSTDAGKVLTVNASGAPIWATPVGGSSLLPGIETRIVGGRVNLDRVIDSSVYTIQSINIPGKNFSLQQAPGRHILIDSLDLGNLGIGILSNPRSRLHLRGYIRSDSLGSKDGKPRILISRANGIIDTLPRAQGVLSSASNGDISWQIASGSGWSLEGNNNLITDLKFLGTKAGNDDTLRLSTRGNTRIRIRPEGNVGIGGVPLTTATLAVYGNMVTGNLSSPSDIRYKKNVSQIGNALQTINKLTGVSYNWRRDEFPQMNFMEGKDLGLIAQEVEKVLPELVMTDDKGFKTVRYTQLIPVLLEAIKEQQKQIEALKTEVSAKDSKVQSSESRIQSLESSMKTLNSQMQLLMEVMGSKEGVKASK